jgi:phage-related minor tail protein
MLVAQKNINNAQFESDTNRQTALDIAKKDVDQAREKLKLAREDFNLHKKASASLEKEKDKQKRNESIVNQLVVARRIILEQEQKAIKEKAKESSELADAERLLGEQAIVATLKNIEIEIEKKKKAAEAEKALNLSVVKNRMDGIDAHYAYEEKKARETAARDKRVAEINNAKYSTRFAGEESLMGMPLTVDKATQKRIDDAVELNRKQDDFLAKQKVQLNAANMISEKTGAELFAAQQINEMALFKLELDKLELKSGDEKYNQLVAYKELMQEAEARTFYRIQLEKEAAEAKRIADAEAQRVNDILLDQYARIEAELEDQAQKQKQLADSIANTFGDAFMSIVDGTKSAKDAFKDMARDIIKQLYRILVVEQMVNSISGAIRGSFGGGAPQGPMPSGNPIPHADGGVVGSPTTFPMTGGRTGLMGEAGPEAIMPLKRGANGKLGVQMEGGATTTVVQNFSFSANGDESVKRIIAQAAPKIAQMTKSEIINDRRRGGTMKATFG